MIRREFFHSLLLGGIVSSVGTRRLLARVTDFPGTRFRNYSRCLPDFLSGLAADSVKARDAELARLGSPSNIEARQQWARETLWKIIGGEPERTPLNPKVTGSFERDGYRVDKVIYESRPRLFVSANLYVPKRGAGPLPAVLFQSGHYWEGKAYPSYQRCCQGLARLGFVVLAFDPMGQGERINYPGSSGTQSRLRSCDDEHTVPGKQLLLFGDSATRFQLWDAIRSLDYLVSLPEVDPKRVGSVGHSGGGTLTMLLAAADQRLAAAAVCMGNTENVAAVPFRAPGATDDAEQDFVGSGPLGFDRWDLLYPFAPKPLLVWPSDRDFYATYSSEYIRNGWAEYQRLQRVYGVLDRTDRLAWGDTPLPHALAYDSRLLVYNWFTRWLQDKPHKVNHEPEVKPEAISTLWATESGSVVESLKSATPFSMNRSRKATGGPVALESLLKVTVPPAPASTKSIGRVQSRHVMVDVLEVPSAPAVWLPAYVLKPDRAAPGRPVYLVLDEADCSRLWFSPEVDQILPQDGPIICAADVRGVGALVPAYSAGAADYAGWHQHEENYAWGSLILGKPLVGQRVTDILAIAAALRRYPSTAGRPIHIAAQGKLAVPALFAAALDTEIKSLYLAGGLVSFKNLVETEIYQHPFANFVPDLLNHTDLPEIAASLGSRRVTLAGPVDAAGTPMQLDAVRSIYRSANELGNLRVVEGTDWSTEQLLVEFGRV
jgi:dienelactone hydrolase